MPISRRRPGHRREAVHDRLTNGQPLRLDDVLAAREAIGGRLHHTPLLTSATLSARTGAEVLLKAELFQRTGSFKPRGMLNALAELSAEEKRRGVISISAGNAAQALAYCAAREGIAALVVMWRGASEQKIEATRSYGGSVDLESSDPAEAFERLDALISETGRTFVHPFDDLRLIAGHGTLGLELLKDAPELDTVVVPVGGGGLISGVAVAIKSTRPETRVVGVEPELAPSLHEALRAGEPVPVQPRSIADGLNAPFAGAHCLSVCQELVHDVVLVTEEEIADGMRFLYARAKLACEPAGAAGAAALLAGKIALKPGTQVAVVVSGGNVAAETASAILAS